MLSKAGTVPNTSPLLIHFTSTAVLPHSIVVKLKQIST